MNDAESKVINLAERRKHTLPGEEQVRTGVDLPEFVSPTTLTQMNDDQLEAIMSLLRLRRLTSTLVYERTVQEKEELRASRSKEQLDKKCEQVWNELERTFKNLEKLETRINEMRALRIQCGMTW